MTTLYRRASEGDPHRNHHLMPPDANLHVPYKFPDAGQPSDQVYQMVTDELMLDGNARQNLATFCTTWADKPVRALMDLSLSKNMIDKDEYPQTAEIEMRCVHMLADLWHSPEAATTIGTSTTGSSEAGMLGGLALKWKWRKRRARNGLPTDKPNIVTGPVQICWHKFARYFDVELRELPMLEGRYTLTPERLAEICDENTIGVVATLGLTFTGHYDPLESVQTALDQLESDTGLNIPIHVDAASGGFVAPFIDPDLNWDFRLPRVHSINASGHKYGLAPLGVGWAVWRSADELPEELIFHVDYLGGKMPTFALNFSRPGGQVISQYYQFLRYGRKGYAEIMRRLRSTAAFVADEIDKMGIFQVIHRGCEGIPVVTWRLRPGIHVPFNLFDLCHELRTSGWQVPAYPLPAALDDEIVARVVIRHGFDISLASAFVGDLRQALHYLAQHPSVKPLTDYPSFNHL